MNNILFTVNISTFDNHLIIRSISNTKVETILVFTKEKAIELRDLINEGILILEENTDKEGTHFDTEADQ